MQIADEIKVGQISISIGALDVTYLCSRCLSHCQGWC
jgi:hypothetical protein